MSDFNGAVRLSGCDGLSRARLRLRIIRLRIALRRARRSHRSQRLTRSSALSLVALFVTGAGVALGCGWMGTEHSVRFNAWRSERAFGRLPPLPFDARTKSKADNSDDDEQGYESRRDSEKRETVAVSKVWDDATAAVDAGDFSRARKLLRDYVERTSSRGCGGWGQPTDCQERRKSASDQLDALEALDRGSTEARVKSYLAARRAFDKWIADTEHRDERSYWNQSSNDEAARLRAEKDAARAAGMKNWERDVEANLSALVSDKNLSDNAAYLRAVGVYRAGQAGDAAASFESVAARFPRSEKREAALHTAGLLSLKASSSYTGEHATAEEACRECRDEGWEKAFALFSRSLRDYPRGRYSADARGWLAYLHLRVGETAEGLAEYYRMLADEADEEAREEALRSLALSHDDATEEDIARVEALIEGEPRVALTYVYHNIYNHALTDRLDIEVSEEANPYLWCKEKDGDSNCSSKYYDWQRQEENRRTQSAESKALARVAAFATRLMRRYPNAQVGGGFALRVAQADLELDEEKAAREFAVRALASGLRDNERASALWVKGVAEHRLKDFVASRRTFASLVSEFPNGDLTEGARRYVAMAAEDAGDLGGALEQYLALDYTEDAAYFVDVLMTPEQLAAFVELHPDSKRRDMLLYSLGVRYMREHRFDEARAVYARIKASDGGATGESYISYDDDCMKDFRVVLGCVSPKSPGEEDAGDVSERWVMRDLKTMEEIEQRESHIAQSAGDEAKAEAAYQLASYFYEASDKTFYNPAAWRGGRFYALYYDQEFRAPDEARLMRRYMESHEPLVRALNVYLQVVRLHPKTRAARDSLYTAAVIHERLSSFLLYWPQQYRLGLQPGERMVAYADVRRTYPGYQLPRGTLGWEPSTRTVNGGPGWAQASKPKRLTRTERVRLKVKRAERRIVEGWSLFGEIGGGRVRRWTLGALRWIVVALVASGLLLVFRLTRRTRRFLYRQLARRRAGAQARETYAPRSSYAAHLPYTWGASFRSATGETAHRLFQLATHERGRAALALNLFTHGLLTLLLWAVLWAMRT